MCKIEGVINCSIHITYLGEVEGVEAAVFGLLERHDLDVEGPGGEVALGDGVVEVLDAVVGVGAGQLAGLLHGQTLDLLVGLAGQMTGDVRRRGTRERNQHVPHSDCNQLTRPTCPCHTQS